MRAARAMLTAPRMIRTSVSSLAVIAACLLPLGLGCGSGGGASTPGTGGSSSGGSSGSSGGSSSGSSSGGSGSSSSGSSSGGGASSGGSSSGGPTGPACTTNADCTGGDQCLFLVGSCSAQGQCLSLGSLGGECAMEVSYCGCNGQTVAGLCGPDYAYGPTLGLLGACPPSPVTAPGETLTTLAEVPQSAPEFLAVDRENVYFTATGLGTVLAAPLGGGAPVTLASGQNQPIGIAAAGGNVFWTNEASGSNDGAVMEVSAAGGTPVVLASGQGAPYQIAVSATTVYWTNLTSPKGVMAVPLGGGTPTLFAAATNPWAVTVFGDEVYYTDGDAILVQPASGGSATTLASGQAYPFDLAVDADHVYWTNANGGGAVLSMPAAGGVPTTLASGYGMSRLAVDGTNVYFTSPGTNNDGSVLSVPLGGGAVTTLVTGQPTPEAIVVDSSAVYWVDTYLGAVMRITPK